MRRQRRRKSFLPQPEFLESRIALSSLIGVNVETNSADNNDPIWTDLHNLATAWSPLSGSSLALSADGYPLANASVSFATENYPDGNYEFSYTGSGTVAFSDVGQIAGSVTMSGGVTTGTITVNHQWGDGNWLNMQVTGVNSANPMDNFHLMMPGYGNGTTPEPMYTPAFLQSLEPFSVIRFMDWENTNDSTVTNWSDRVTPTSFTTDGSGGVPYEDMIELSNEAQKDMWINIPVMATPQFVQSLAQLIDANLDPNLNVYVEYGNENWNTGYTQCSQVLAAAESNPLVTQSSNSQQMVAQQSAYEEVSDSQIVEQVFGSASGRIRPILAGWCTGPTYQQYELQFIQQTYGPPSQFIYATAVAPYISLPSGDNVAGLTLNQVFADLNQYLATTIVPSLQSDAAVSQQYGIPLFTYEGGQSLVPGANGLNFAVMNQAQNDPRMYQLYVALLSDWQQDGGGLFVNAGFAGPATNFGFWQLLPSVLSAGSQEYDALISEIEPAGDANLDGIVDNSDFETLAAHYGNTNAYWEQGDFNDDGTVNWQDLNILRQNLDPAGFTLSQFAQQALFGQLGTVTSGQSLEYDGYGVTYASSLPFASSSGTVKLNQNSQGTGIVLGGAAYSEGLGVLANSSISLTLNGSYSQFESTIGVDGSSNTGSSVIFDLYGNGQLLYQSPTLTYASGAIPIDVNIAGITTLTLTVSAASGSNPLADNAVWADARLISTANFGSTQPYSLTWQLSQNGTVLTTQTEDSFVFGAISGTYTLTLTVTDAQGDTATASTNVVVTPASASASFITLDSNTQGNWAGTYGSQGYDIASGPSSLPSDANVTFSGASVYTWNPSTKNAGSLQLDSGPYGVAGCWYAPTSFTVNVNVIDGQEHDLVLYAVDFDNQGRSENIEIVSASTGAVLDSRNISSFATGVYLQWDITGDVEIVVTKLGPQNAVLSGIFLGPAAKAPAAAFLGDDTTTKGNWIGTYGTQGYDVIGNVVDLPGYATVTPSGQSASVWSTTTTLASALEDAPGAATGDIAACWYGASFSVDINLTDGLTHDVELYFLDWGSTGRSEQVTVSSAYTGAVLNTETVSSFGSGVYMKLALTGDVLLTFTSLSGANAVLSGLFFDPSTLHSASAVFMDQDTATEGTWIDTYGSQGYDIIGNAVNLPSYALATPAGQTVFTWSASTTDPRALQTVGGASRIAACWFSATSFTVDVNLTDSLTHDLELYFLDWDKSGRSEQVTLSDAVTGTVLDTVNVSSFSSGVYLQWAVSGNVLITITKLAGPNAVLSGLFFGPQTAPTVSITSSAFVDQDTTTEGNWIGTYGSDGYDVVGSTVSIPSYATITPAGQTVGTWSASTTDPRALQTGGGTSRTAACWYSTTSFTVDVDLTDGLTHDLQLYFVDWDSTGRSEQVTISNISTGAVLNTETVSSFHSGIYLEWAVSGNVLITITRLSGINAVLSGLFFGPQMTPATSCSFLDQDTTTEGNWIGTYGSAGYDVIGNAASIPSYATVTPAGQSVFTWSASTTNPQALQTQGGTSRIAACWYSSTSFTVDVNLTDGLTHDLELYFLDWDATGRSEQVTISNATTGVVLNAATVSSFSSGIYLEWAVSGNILITITKLQGTNAVLSGLFFDPSTISTNTLAASVVGEETGNAGVVGMGELSTSTFIESDDSQVVATTEAITSAQGAVALPSTVSLNTGHTARIGLVPDLAKKRRSWSTNTGQV